MPTSLASASVSASGTCRSIPDGHPGLTYAAIAPHGALAIPGADPSADAKATQEAMAELGRRFSRAAPAAVILLTPHNVHVEGAMAVIVAGRLEGSLAQWGAPQVTLAVPVAGRLAEAVRDFIRDEGIPVVGVSYGGNDAREAVHPMDWATLIPLWFMGGRAEPPVPVVVVSPARDLTPASHVRAGGAISRAAQASGMRVALIASCDHGHGHLASGPYGHRPASAQFDELVVGAVRENRLADLIDLDPALVAAAAADSWWQMLMLAGALETTGRKWAAELLSYEHPTYFGMLCAAYTASDFTPAAG